MQKQWLGVVAAIAAAGVISLFSARRIEAQYSSPVKVMNTTSAPALNSSVDDHGRVAYQSMLFKGCSSAACTFTFGPVPAGHRLVIEHVSGALELAGSASDVIVQLHPASLIPPSMDLYAAFSTPNPSGFFDQPTLTYVDSLQSINIIAFLRGGATYGPNNRMMIAGYMLDCAAAPCAAIAR